MRTFIFIFFSVLFLLTALKSSGQTPSDGLFMKKKELCIAALYSQDKWNQYWEGSLLRENQNIGTLSRQTVLPMLAYGISDKVNVFISLPYVSTEASGGQMVGASGWQDLGIFLKYKAMDIETGSFRLTGSLTGGYSLPASSYLSDYLPFSLGLGTQEWSGRLIFKSVYKERLYFRGSAAFLHRTTTEAERDYYYADKGYYTTTMDVPDAVNTEIAIGGWMLNRAIQVEVAYNNQTSQSGDDIRRQNQPQPTNKMDFTMISYRLRYYTPFLSGLSVMLSYSDVLSGRNFGKSQIIQSGLTYQFQF